MDTFQFYFFVTVACIKFFFSSLPVAFWTINSADLSGIHRCLDAKGAYQRKFELGIFFYFYFLKFTMMMFHFWSVFLNPDCFGSPEIKC